MNNQRCDFFSHFPLIPPNFLRFSLKLQIMRNNWKAKYQAHVSE